jgi:hypothetical protein
LLDGVAGEGLPFAIRCLHNQIPLSDGRLTQVGKAHWHGIDPRPHDLWDRIDPSARRAVRRSQRHGVEVTPARSTGELRAFYQLHLRVRKHKYRMLAQPYSFFENLWRHFVAADAGTLMLARVNGAVAAGVLFLEWKDTLYYKFNASDPDFTDSRPNDAIMWAGIEYARKRDLSRIDLGLSDWDQVGLVRYKGKYASEEKTISFLSYLPEGVPEPPPSPLASAMPGLTDLLTDPRVPDSITERAGSALYRFFA